MYNSENSEHYIIDINALFYSRPLGFFYATHRLIQCHIEILLVFIIIPLLKKILIRPICYKFLLCDQIKLLFLINITNITLAWSVFNLELLISISNVGTFQFEDKFA